MFQGTQEIMSLFKSSMISCLYVKQVYKKFVESLVENLPKHDKGFDCIHGMILILKTCDDTQAPLSVTYVTLSVTFGQSQDFL